MLTDGSMLAPAKTGSEALHPTTMQHHRFHLLDALRGVAAILVSAVHAPQVNQLIGLHSGFLAVDFFFCLSGFVVAFSYERRLMTGLRMKTFVVARLIRLYPVYLFAMLTGIYFFGSIRHLIIQPFFDKKHFIVLSIFSLFMIPNVFDRWHPFLFPLDFPAWSMFYEVIANIGYALAIRTLGIRASVPWIAWTASLGTLVYGSVHRTTLEQYGWPSTGSLLVFAFARVLLSFSSGVLVLRFYRALAIDSPLHHLQSYLWVLIFGGILAILFAPLSFMQKEWFRLFAIACVFPFLILGGAVAKVGHSWEGLCSFLGEISYPFYLFHIVYFQALEYLRYKFAAQRHPSVLLETVVLIYLSYCVARYADVPVRRWLTLRFNARSSKTLHAA